VFLLVVDLFAGIAASVARHRQHWQTTHNRRDFEAARMNSFMLQLVHCEILRTREELTLTGEA
jgi:hypothetical protein